MSKKVLIVGTDSHPPGYTTKKRAEHYVSSGRAVLVGSNAIKFVEHDHRHQSCLASMNGNRAERRRKIRNSAVLDVQWVPCYRTAEAATLWPFLPELRAGVPKPKRTP